MTTVLTTCTILICFRTPQTPGGSVISVPGAKPASKPKKSARRYAPKNSSVKLPDGAAKASSLIASFNAKSPQSSAGVGGGEHVFGVARPTSLSNSDLIEQELNKFVAEQGN